MTDLIDILGFPSVSLVVGKRQHGKTACGGKVLEDAHRRGLKTYWLGLPRSKWNLLPKWIKPVENIDNLPDEIAIVFDEIYLYALARDHPKEFNKFLYKIIGISAQKRWIVVFCSHTARKFDIGGVLEVDNIITRKPSWLYARFERPEIRELIKEAFEWFNKNKEAKKEPKKWALIFTDYAKQPIAVKLPLPEFWSEELSRAFSGVSLKKIGKGGEEEIE